MPSFITPARLTALAGVLTGLAAAVTAALGVVPHDGQVYLVGQEVAGLFTTGVSVAKFLEGQAGWEQLQAANHHDRMTQLQAQQHEAAIVAQKHANELALYNQPAQDNPHLPADYEPPMAELPDEVPLDTIDETGVIINEVSPETGEPKRLWT